MWVSLAIYTRLEGYHHIGRDFDWIKLNTVFTKDVATMAFLLRLFPAFLRPYVFAL